MVVMAMVMVMVMVMMVMVMVMVMAMVKWWQWILRLDRRETLRVARGSKRLRTRLPPPPPAAPACLDGMRFISDTIVLFEGGVGYALARIILGRGS